MSLCRLIRVGALAALFASGLAAQAEVALAEALRALDEPVTLQTAMGRDFTGQPIRVTSAGVQLRTRVDGGEVEFEFAREEIRQVRFPGNSLKQTALDLAGQGQFDGALAVIDGLFVQRSPFFSYTGEREARYFAETLSLYREADRTLEGLARAEVLQPFLVDPALRQAVEREQMISYHRLGLAAQARPLAEAGIAREGRHPVTALPALVLAQLQVAEGEGDAALFTLLHPIVFSATTSVEDLDLCYAMAIDLARILHQPELAERLAAERAERNLTEPTTWAPLPEPDFSPLTTLQPPP